MGLVGGGCRLGPMPCRRNDVAIFPAFSLGAGLVFEHQSICADRIASHGAFLTVHLPLEPRHRPLVRWVLQRTGRTLWNRRRYDFRPVPSAFHGDFGEPIFPMGWNHDEARRFGDNGSGALDFWCGDPSAREDFRNFARQRYRDVAHLNAAWKTNFPALADVTAFPARRAPVSIRPILPIHPGIDGTCSTLSNGTTGE